METQDGHVATSTKCGNTTVTLLMAGHKNPMSNLIQSGIETFIQRSPANSTNPKKPLASPESDNPPSKRAVMPSQEEQEVEANRSAIQLPPDLQLLYDNLIKKIDEKIKPVESKLNSLVGSEFNLPKHIEDINEVKVQHKNLERKLTKVERENKHLKQKITNLEDKMLEYNIVLSGIDEDKWEEPEPRLDKVNRELLRITTGNAQTETTETTECVTKLDIMSTERLGHYNPAWPRPISVRFIHKKDVDLILANKKKLDEGIFVDRQYSDETESETKRLRPILTAERKIKEYRGRCKMEGMDLVI